jgi:hypothetical protein
MPYYSMIVFSTALILAVAILATVVWEKEQ